MFSLFWLRRTQNLQTFLSHKNRNHSRVSTFKYLKSELRLKKPGFRDIYEMFRYQLKFTKNRNSQNLLDWFHVIFFQKFVFAMKKALKRGIKRRNWLIFGNSYWWSQSTVLPLPIVLILIPVVGFKVLDSMLLVTSLCFSANQKNFVISLAFFVQERCTLWHFY